MKNIVWCGSGKLRSDTMQHDEMSALKVKITGKMTR